MEALIDSLKVALLGMSVTFIMLIIIVGFVKILNPVLRLCGKAGTGIKRLFSGPSGRRKDKAPVPENAVSESARAQQPAAEGINGAEVAAIAAAVSCMTGLDGDMFVLKSIRRSRAESWKRR